MNYDEYLASVANVTLKLLQDCGPTNQPSDKLLDTVLEVTKLLGQSGDFQELQKTVEGVKITLADIQGILETNKIARFFGGPKPQKV